MKHLILVAIGIFCLLATAGPAASTDSSVELQETSDAAVHNAKGLELYNSNKYEEAINSYKQAIKLKKDYADAHYNLGDAYFQLKKYKDAIEAYKQALKYRPDSSMTYNHLGTAHFKSGEYKKAIEAYKNAIRLDPKTGLNYYNLGSTYAERGDKKAALQQYEILKNVDAQLAQKLYLVIHKPLAAVFDATSGVRLNVIAVDARGYLVNNLNQDDFQIIEQNITQDGSPISRNDFKILDDTTTQSITTFSKESYPLVYGLVIDSSGSMREVLPDALTLSKAIIENSRPEDETLIVRFVSSDKIETIEDFTSDKSRLKEGLETFYVEMGQSAVIDAVYISAERVAQYRPEHSSYLRRALILITDGEERISYYTLNTLVELLRKLDVQVFAICLNKNDFTDSQLNFVLPRTAMPLLTTLANETGGQAFFPKSVTELSTVAKQVMAMSRTQYLIGYKPAKSVAPLMYRRVTVNVVDKPGRGKIETVVRAGYTVPEAKPAP